MTKTVLETKTVLQRTKKRDLLSKESGNVAISSKEMRELYLPFCLIMEQALMIML